MHARSYAHTLYLNFPYVRFNTFFQNEMCFDSMGTSVKHVIIRSIPFFPFSMSLCSLSNKSIKNAYIIKYHVKWFQHDESITRVSNTIHIYAPSLLCTTLEHVWSGIQYFSNS